MSDRCKVTRLYLSGPMTGLPEFNFLAFNRAAAYMESLGFDVVNPAEKGIVEGWTWEDYLRYDLKVMLECDGVITLPGYESSRGAKLETYVAEQLGMAIRPFSDFADVSVLDKELVVS